MGPAGCFRAGDCCLAGTSDRAGSAAGFGRTAGVRCCLQGRPLGLVGGVGDGDRALGEVASRTRIRKG